ncbi:MAG: mechanosensitive ion channel domain-containing protein [Gammaproteobacteria bacterium]
MTIDSFSIEGLAAIERIALVLAIAIAAHFFIRVFRHYTYHLLSTEAIQRWTKLRTLAGLVLSILIFSMYFGALGLVLHEFGVSLTAYLASASILGLAIGFGSQGLVQDVVTGLTVIFTDLFQVGDLVEISGQTGTIQSIGMRFTALLSPLGAQVFIPNRTLANVTIYPRGYVRCYADITISADTDIAQQMQAKVKAITRGFVEQFPGILRAEPDIGQPRTTPVGRVFVRVKFRIWPGRSATIDSAYKQEIVATLKIIDPDYADWMVSINTEVSDTPTSILPYRMSRARKVADQKKPVV